MPDTPGGPIDPNRLITLIKNGAPWRDDGIVVGGARKRLVPEGGAWQTANEGHRLSPETYDLLNRCTPNGHLFTVDRVTYKLAPTTIGGVPWAVQQTA